MYFLILLSSHVNFEKKLLQDQEIDSPENVKEVYPSQGLDQDPGETKMVTKKEHQNLILFRKHLNKKPNEKKRINKDK